MLESSADATWLTGISGADADTAWGSRRLLGDGFGLGGIIAGTLDEGATLNLQASDPRGKFNGVSAVDSQTAYVWWA